MCLPTACCAIGKYRCIISVQNAVQQTPGCGLVYLSLGRIFIEDSVEAECVVLRSPAWGTSATRKSLNSMVVWRIENSVELSISLLDLSEHCALQAPIVYHFKHGPKAFGTWSCHRRSCQRPISKEQWAIRYLCELSCFPDLMLLSASLFLNTRKTYGKWSNSYRDAD